MSGIGKEILSAEEFSIKPFSSIKIGDPLYFESQDANGLRFTIDFPKIPVSNREAGIYLERANETYDGFKINSIKVVLWTQKKDFIMQSSNKSLAEIHKSEAYVPALVKKETVLGCDSAQFMIEANDDIMNIDTGADGEYGRAFHYKDNRAFIIELYLDGDYVDYSRLKAELGRTFNCPEMLQDKTQNYDKWLEGFAKEIQNYGKKHIPDDYVK